MEVATGKKDSLINEAIISSMKKSKEIILFVISIVIATIFLLLFALPIVLPKVSESLFNGFEVFAVPYEAEIVEGRVNKKIVWVNSVEFEDLAAEDLIVVNYQGSYWIEKIERIDSETNEVVTTYDGTVARRHAYSDIAGIYDRDASITGVFYYFASKPLGLLVIALAFAGSLYLGHRGFVKDIKKHVQHFKDVSDYEKAT